MTDAWWFHRLRRGQTDMWDNLMGDATDWTLEIARSHRERWEAVVAEDVRATAAQKSATCRGCGRCCLPQHVCVVYPVCMFCDEWVQPYAANPRNAHHVRCRVPAHIADAMYNTAPADDRCAKPHRPETLSAELERKLHL